MRAFDVLLFDLGSTLIYFDTDWSQVFNQANEALVGSLKSFGLALDDGFQQEFRARLGQYFAERDAEFIEYTTAYVLRTLLAERGYPNLPEDTLRIALRAMYAVSQAHWQAEEDAIPTLETLRRVGYRLGMISNAADDEDVQTLVEKANLRPYFEFILTSAVAGIRKPNPRIFTYALDTLRVPAGRAAMVGDTLGADILGAQNAGVFSIWIKRRADVPGNQSHADTIRPEAIIERLSDLPALLESLAKEQGS
ncbi:MAG TPA: HAD family hydrolase [Anaerolineales bacterium]|nr:HAD family hydrolase [Anaerolineales bacterium]